MTARRACLVVGACFCINAFTLAVVRSGAIVYVGVANTFQLSREDASWPLCLATVFNLAAGPVTGVLARHIDISRLIVVACLLTSLSVSACYFAAGVSFLVVSLGALHGFGLSLLTLTYAVINQSVTRYKALALGVANGGFVLGGIVFPPLVQYLFDEYGTRGALLVTGAIMLNSTAAAFFTRPGLLCVPNTNAPCHSKTPRRDLDEDSYRQKESAEDSSYDTCPSLLQSAIEQTKLPRKNEHIAKSETLKRLRISALRSAKDSTLAACLSFMKRPKFYVVAYTMGQAWFLITTLLTVVVDFATDHDIPKWEALSLVTLLTVPDLVARFTSGLITDKHILAKSTMMTCCCAVTALAYFLVPCLPSYPALAVLVVFVGWCNGAVVTQAFALCAELVEASTFSLCLGAAYFLGAIALFERPLIIGYCRDQLGSYDGVFYLMAATAMSCAALWMAVRLQERCSNSKRSKRTKSLGGSDGP